MAFQRCAGFDPTTAMTPAGKTAVGKTAAGKTAVGKTAAGRMTAGLRILGAAAAIFAVSALPASAQPAAPTPSTFPERIEAAATAMRDIPRFKGLNQQQRVDRIAFVVGNTLVLLLHEMGHVLVHQMNLPVLAREEDAADTYAALRMLQIGTAFSLHGLADAAQGWFFNDRRDQQIGEKPLLYDEHGLSQQRAYQIVCLMVGSDPVRFKGLADQHEMPQSRQNTCKLDYATAVSGWTKVLAPFRREPGQPQTKITVVYGEGKGQFASLADMFRSIRFLETVAEHAQDDYLWPHPFTIEMQTCGHPGSDYDTDTRVVTMCYETAFDFAELYRAYVPLKPAPTVVSEKSPPAAAPLKAGPAASSRKRKSK